ncbi:hypothetical protein ACFOWM_08405 [Ferruginibacter yonginensis]|uniref:Uncharacterized protein n=1 Tax=Ferruginibacter yonginensis TaxID=1310416 RepID=A0ABV8QV43_9BACT
MLQALVISNNIFGIEGYYQSNTVIQYHFYKVTKNFQPNLQAYDVLVVPNGCDNVAMLTIKDDVQTFLNSGKALICCDGWFTNWVPGNQWRMDISKKTIDVRYFVKDDPYQLFNDLDVNEFIFSNGMSGYWACGYIDAAAGAHVVLEDTWQRPIIVVDDVTTNGIMFLTASGPLGDINKPYNECNSIDKLYKNFINKLTTIKNLQHA